MKCHVRGCTNEAADGLPCCWPCADHVCTKKCLRRSGGFSYCNRVEPVIVRISAPRGSAGAKRRIQGNAEEARVREAKHCDTCLYWSDLVAEANGDGPLMALCENPDSDKRGRMTDGKTTCSEWASLALSGA